MGNYNWLDKYLLEKLGATKDYKEEWGAYRYLIGGKMFAMDTFDKEGRPIVSFKLDPVFGDTLRQQYEGEIVPGYYMNKVHWNSLHLTGHVPESIVKQMADESYTLVFKGLTKKLQHEILSLEK